jgi:hypothetical protein
MSSFENKSNNELMELLKEMEITHENIKRKMLKHFANLEKVERDHKKVQDILKKRLNK